MICRRITVREDNN